jgi:hypothetical protein
MSHSLRTSLLALLVGVAACAGTPSESGASNTGGGSGAGGPNASGGLTASSGGVSGTSSATGGAATDTGGVAANSGGGAPGTGGTSPASTLLDAANSAEFDASPTTDGRLMVGVNVHDYPQPTAYGFTTADGKDRMGNGLVEAGVTLVRGATIGDTTFLSRLHDFGVKEALLGLSASAQGKPFDPAKVGPALQKSIAAAQAVGLTVRVEGLNEWDLFNTKTYNAGVIPAGMTASEFVSFTQHALYEAAHPLGITVLGPSVGHFANLGFFPDVSADVDVVNAHIYFTSNPESLALGTLVAGHEQFEGSGKPFWVTETGVSSYGAVTADDQADIIRRGLSVFAKSGLIRRAYVYELLDDQQPGWAGTTYTPDDAEYHFGLFTFAGVAKPAEGPVHDFIAGQ